MSLATRLAALVVVVVFIAPALARAQPLADRVPADALFYAAWAGADHLDGYADSRLKAVLAESSLPQFVAEFPGKVLDRLAQQNLGPADAVAKDALRAGRALADAAWRHPTALYVGPINLAERLPIPRLALFCQAGQSARPIADQLTALVKQLPPDAPVKLRVQVWPGDLLVVSTFELGSRIEESLAQRDVFKAALKQVRPNPALIAYLDTEKVINIASLGVTLGAPDQVKTLFRQVLATTGLAGVRRVCLAAGFDNRDWATDVFVDAPPPRSGLLANLLSAQPVSDDLIKFAPKSATWLAATRVDLAETLRLARVVTQRLADPKAAGAVEDAVAHLNQTIGFDLQKELLAGLGDQWLVYTSEQTGEGLAGLCLVAPLRDRAKVEAAFAKLEKLAGEAFAKGPQAGGVSVAIKTEQLAGLTVHHLPMPAFDPAYAIKGDVLYVALYPQVLIAAAKHDPAAADGTVLASDAFRAARQRLGSTAANTVVYADLPALAPRAYPIALALTQTGAGFIDLLGLDGPALVLPPLPKLAPHLTPAISATRIDDAGWHYRSVTPFPGASVLAGEPALLASAPAVLGVAIPALDAARTRAHRDAGNVVEHQIVRPATPAPHP